MTFAGNFLVVEDPPEKVDIIAIFSGDPSGERVKKGVELFKKGYAEKIVMLGGLIQWNTWEPEIMKKHAEHLGVPEDSIVVIKQGVSTYNQAKSIISHMKTNNYKSLILVTSNYHSRRTSYIVRHLFSKAGLRTIICPSLSRQFLPSQWWNNPEHVKVVFYEYTRLLWYWIKYY